MYSASPGPAAALLGECRRGCSKRRTALRGELGTIMDEMGALIVSPGTPQKTVAFLRDTLLGCGPNMMKTDQELEGLRNQLAAALARAKGERGSQTMAGLFRIGNLLGATTPGVPATRPSCTECVEKHLGSAWALITETQNGYPHHMYAVGHLHEAEDESQEWPALHAAIRDARKKYQQEDVMPDWAKLRGLLDQAKAS
jgi:hypothetical protein